MSNPPKFKSMSTPRGVAVWPSLNTPDTKFKPEGEYTCRLAFEPDADGVPEMLAELEKRLDVLWDHHLTTLDTAKRKQFEKAYSKAPIYTAELDKEGDETGRILLNFKMKASGVSKKTNKPWKRQPVIVDARGQKMANPPDIYGGSVLRVGFEVGGGPVPSSKLFYLSLRLELVKVIELVSRGGASADSFGMGEEEEGFEADADSLKASSSRPAGDDSEPASETDTGDGDF